MHAVILHAEHIVADHVERVYSVRIGAYRRRAAARTAAAAARRAYLWAQGERKHPALRVWTTIEQSGCTPAPETSVIEVIYR